MYVAFRCFSLTRLAMDTFRLDKWTAHSLQMYRLISHHCLRILSMLMRKQWRLPQMSIFTHVPLICANVAANCSPKMPSSQHFFNMYIQNPPPTPLQKNNKKKQQQTNKQSNKLKCDKIKISIRYDVHFTRKSLTRLHFEAWSKITLRVPSCHLRSLPTHEQFCSGK